MNPPDEEDLLSLGSGSQSDSDHEDFVADTDVLKKRKNIPNGNGTSEDGDSDDTMSSINDHDNSLEVTSKNDRECRLPSAEPGPANNGTANAEVLLSDSDEDNEDATSSATATNAVNPNSSSPEDADNGPSRYGLRRKRKINYTEIENRLDLIDEEGDKHRSKKDVFDIFSLPVEKISRFTHKPELVDNHTRCKLCFMDGTNRAKINVVGKFFEKCGQQFESIFIHIRYDDENFTFLTNLFKTTFALGKIDYRYQSRDDALQILVVLERLRVQNHLPSLHSLKLISRSGDKSLTEKHLGILSEMNIQFQNVELGDSLWEDVKPATFEKFLERQKFSLESLIIHGGFRGDTDKERVVIQFPQMEKLTTLCICPKYDFLSEIKNPYSKKARVVTLGGGQEEPYKIAIKFSCDIPSLQRLVLGNLIEIEDLLFSSLRKITEFRCGSYWNLPIRFPAMGSRKALMESSITELQFPDALKDPSFPVKVVKHFPHLKKVWMFLPSVPVLRAFFKAFESSKVEEIYLKTQFDFESTMESCLLPRMSDVLRRSHATDTLLRTLKEYKHFDEYVRYYNVELPVEAEDLMEGHSAGIRALKNLKVLHLEHIPRKLLIPIPDDERKWYDHNCKFMSTTFGYERYPLNYRCHREILALDLSEYIWKNIQIDSDFTNDFYQAGFVDIPDVVVTQDIGGYRSYSNVQEEEDIFTPVQRARSSGAQVKIMPSMLLPDVKIKPEGS